MKVTFILVSALACLLLLAGCHKDERSMTDSTTPGSPSAGAPDLATPESTVRTFYEALNYADLKQAAACILGAKPESDFTQMSQAIKASPTIFLTGNYRAQITGATASVTMDIAAKQPSAGMSDPQTSAKADTYEDTISLQQQGGKWLILPPQGEVTMSNGNKDYTKMLVSLLSDPAKANAVFGEAREKAKSISCESNARQICTGILMYAQDYDDRYPYKAVEFKMAIMPYIKNEVLFHCPSDQTGAESYTFNKNLEGVTEAAINSPAETVLIYEGKDEQLEYRHMGKAVVGYADGHVKLIGPDQAQSLHWKPSDPGKPFP